MQLIDLERGPTRALITPEIGGRLHQLSIRDGRTWLPLLHARDDPAQTAASPATSSSYMMAPWPNRIDGGRFIFGGRLYEIPTKAGGHALHGRTLWQPWTVERQSRTACRLSVEIDLGWPFGGHVVQEISLEDRSIVQKVELHTDRAPFPAGVGWHRWWRRDVRPRHDAHVLVDAGHTYETVDMIPTGWLRRVDDNADLRRYPAIADRRLDTCYRHPRGDLRIRWADIELCMTSSANVTHAVVCTTPDAVAVEPQTCAIDAFNLAAQGIEGAGMSVVRPGRPLAAWTRWRWTIGQRQR
jgi:aldose 1-epimerase